MESLVRTVNDKATLMAGAHCRASGGQQINPIILAILVSLVTQMMKYLIKRACPLDHAIDRIKNYDRLAKRKLRSLIRQNIVTAGLSSVHEEELEAAFWRVAEETTLEDLVSLSEECS